MALVLAQDRPFNFLYRTILFIPWAVPTIVAALSYRWIYDDFSGLYNNLLLALFDMGDVISWLGDPNLAMGSVIAVVVWSGTPFYTMSFLAGLKAIPNELYEAARIDGAGVWQEFWHITVPQMRKVFVIVVMLSTIWTSTNLVIVQILTNGGPAERDPDPAEPLLQIRAAGGAARHRLGGQHGVLPAARDPDLLPVATHAGANGTSGHGGSHHQRRPSAASRSSATSSWWCS